MMPLNPLHHNLSIHFLHTLFYTFLLVLTRRIGLTIKVSLLASFSFILMILMNDSAVLL